MKDDMNELKKRALAIVDIYSDLNRITERETNILREAITTDRPQGEWIKVYSDLDYEEYQCSICGRVVIIYKNVDKKELLERYPFCNCGADLRGKKNDDVL